MLAERFNRQRPRRCRVETSVSCVYRQGALNKRTREAQELAAALIEGDPTYLEGLKSRIKVGQAPHMERLLWGSTRGEGSPYYTAQG